MEGNRLVYLVCVVVSVLGVLVSALVQSPLERVDALSPDLLGREVVLRGVVVSKSVNNGHVFLRVNGFKAVVFEKNAKRLQYPYFILEGDEVKLRGKVQEYEGEIELVVEGVESC